MAGKGWYRNKSFWFLAAAAGLHLLMLTSLLSEPFAWNPGENMTGTKTHPAEPHSERGWLDSFFHDTDRVPRGLDFFSIYQAGYNFLHGCSVYYGVREHRFGSEYLVVPYFSGFRYLPAYACSFGAALTLLPPWSSYWSWIGIVELLLFFNIYALKWLPVDPQRRWFLAGIWLAYSPFYVELHIGQQSMVTVTLLHLLGIAHIHARSRTRDACYIMSTLWKLNTILFFPLWIKFKRIPSLIILGLLIFLLSAPYFLNSPGSFAEFRDYFHMKLVPGPSSLGLWTFFSVILHRIHPGLQNMHHILNLVSLGIFLLASTVTLLPRRIRFIEAFCMWICVYFLTYQYVWEHHYVMMLPVFSLMMAIDRSKIWIWIWLFCALPTPYIFINLPSTDMPQLFWPAWIQLLYHGMKCIPVACIFTLIAVRLVQNGADDPFLPDRQWSVQDLLSRSAFYTEGQPGHVQKTFPQNLE